MKGVPPLLPPLSPPLRCQCLTLNMFDGDRQDHVVRLRRDRSWRRRARTGCCALHPGRQPQLLLLHRVPHVGLLLLVVVVVVLAALGFKEAFAFVKERRLVASPNVAFTCNLVEWAKLRSAAAGAGGAARLEPLLLRVAAHGAHDPSRLVVKVCRSEKDYRRTVKPAPDALDTRVVFIVLAQPNPAAATPADDAKRRWLLVVLVALLLRLGRRGNVGRGAAAAEVLSTTRSWEQRA